MTDEPTDHTQQCALECHYPECVCSCHTDEPTDLSETHDRTVDVDRASAGWLHSEVLSVEDLDYHLGCTPGQYRPSHSRRVRESHEALRAALAAEQERREQAEHGEGVWKGRAMRFDGERIRAEARSERYRALESAVRDFTEELGFPWAGSPGHDQNCGIPGPEDDPDPGCTCCHDQIQLQADLSQAVVDALAALTDPPESGTEGGDEA